MSSEFQFGLLLLQKTLLENVHDIFKQGIQFLFLRTFIFNMVYTTVLIASLCYTFPL
jgi:hypothetical protein